MLGLVMIATCCPSCGFFAALFHRASGRYRVKPNDEHIDLETASECSRRMKTAHDALASHYSP